MPFIASCDAPLVAAALCVLLGGCSPNESPPPREQPDKSSAPSNPAEGAPEPTSKGHPRSPADLKASFSERPVAFATDPQKPASVLSCTLSLPKGAQAHPAAVIIGQAAPRDRHGTDGTTQPYARAAHQLARNGVAVLRCDARGIGGSKGRATMLSLTDRERDARAMWQFLKAQKGTDPLRIGFIGHEQGAWIAARVAAANPGVAFIVGLGPVAADGVTTLRDRLERSLRDRGVGREKVEVAGHALKRVMDVVRSRGSEGALTAAVEALVSAEYKAAPTPSPSSEREPRRRTEQMRWRTQGALTWVNMRPTVDYEALVATPSLFIFGRKDARTRTQLHHALASKSLTQAGHPRHEVRVLDGDVFDEAALREVPRWIRNLPARMRP